MDEDNFVREVVSNYDLQCMREKVEKQEKRKPFLKKRTVCVLAVTMLGFVGGCAALISCTFVDKARDDEARGVQKQILEKYDYDMFNENMREQKTEEVMEKFYHKEIDKDSFEIEYKKAQEFVYDPTQYAKERATEIDFEQYQLAQAKIDDNTIVAYGAGALGAGVAVAFSACGYGMSMDAKDKNKKVVRESVK